MSESTAAAGAAGERNDVDLAREVAAASATLSREIGKVIVGQQRVVENLLTALLAEGHVLIVGVPGLAKTLLVKTIAQILHWRFRRIQFTPDMMPADIIGAELLHEDRATGGRSLRFVKGPIFANIILADEINRTPPKTQAALLEAMQEYQVTAGGEEFALERPFVVVATQNPIEQEGTYPLPEAQLDRFMFMLRIDYPTRQEEEQIVMATTAGQSPDVQQVFSAEQIVAFQSLVRRVPVSPHVVGYAVALARASRPTSDDADRYVRQYVQWGAGPRASQYMTLAAKARAVILGDSAVRCQHIRDVAPQVLRHRVLVNYNATGDGITSEQVIAHLLETVGEPSYTGAAAG